MFGWQTGKGGSGGGAITTLAPGYHATALDYAVAVGVTTVVVDSSGGPVEVTLPNPAGAVGRWLRIKRKAGDDVTLTPAAGTIDGAANHVLVADYEAIDLVSDGSEWLLC